MFTDDLKFGWRQLVNSPGFSLTAILTLGLAIGANTAVFSLVDAVMLRPLPYPQPDRLALLAPEIHRSGARLGENTSHTGAVWEAMRDQAVPGLYVPFAQFQTNGLRTFHGWFMPAWIMRASAPGAVTEPAIRRAMAEVDPELPFASVRAVDEVRGAAFGMSGLLRSLLWGVRPNDPLTFAVVVATLLAVAVAASVLPALRVRRLDPVSLLRSE